MPLTWNDLTVNPYDVNFDALLGDWRWLVGPSLSPVVITALGDLFLRGEDGSIHWLDTVAGRLTKVAADAEEFKALMVQPEHLDEWFMPQLVGDLKEAGVSLGTGQCYSYKVPPVLSGPIDPSNIEPADLLIHFSLMGQIHRQVKDLPEGTPIHEFNVKEP
jgi:hypothetical protein